MSTKGGFAIAGPQTPAGVTSPVFWGSFIGILVGSVMAGLSYLDVVGSAPVTSESVSPAAEPHAIAVFFCCLLCVRYYASIVFLSYDSVASAKVQNLTRGARRTVFAVQVILIFGCGLNIGVLPIFGGAAATAVIVGQATSVLAYWKHLWRVLLMGPDSKYQLLLALGDFTILVSAITFFTWEMGWFEYDQIGAGMCMGAIIFVFIGETITTYLSAIITFVRETGKFLST